MKKNFPLLLLLISVLFLINSCTGLSITKPEDEPDELPIVDINADIIFGNFVMAIGINCGPLSVYQDHDYTNIFQELGVKIIRTHDYYGPCDWYTIFPDWENDENNPESYNFGSSDQVINAITDGGFDVLFRLGPSWNDPVFLYNNDPPGTIRDNQENITHIADHNDFLKFATICKNIVRHYNEGWAGGYFLDIKRWEIWNEPSLASQFWSGTAIQFYDMFSAVFFSLKGFDNTLKVGGPGLAGHSTDEYETGLLEYCMNNNLWIDYFSWHNYGNEGGGGENSVQSPGIIGSRANFVRGKMDDFGFGSAGSVCSEWNADLGDRNFTDSGKGAAFFGGALTLMEEKGIEESYLYRGDNHPLGIFKNLTELKTGAYVLKAWKTLSSENIRIFASTPDDSPLYIIASKSQSGSSAYIMISNYSETDMVIILNVLNVNALPKLKWEKVEWEVSEYKKYDIVAGPDPISKTGDAFRINLTINSESVKLICIRNIVKK